MRPPRTTSAAKSSPVASSGASAMTTRTDGTGGCAPPSWARSAVPRRPDSMALDYSHPDVLTPPEHPPTCCTQQTISVPEAVLAKTTQKHDYPSKAWRRTYIRRTGSERTFAWLGDPAAIGMRRGWCRLFATTKNALMFVLGVVVRNVRIVISFERQQADDARRQAMGLESRRRRRHRRRYREATPSAPAPDEVPSEPG
jgi:hypothetical protein